MPTRYLFTATLAALLLCTSSRTYAQIETTTEYGITITPDQLMNAIAESQGFWPGVRKHIVSDQFAVADPAVRQEAVKFLKRVDSRLADMLFGGDVEQGQALMKYLGARIRKFQMYRELRATVNNDPLMCDLKNKWEVGVREIYKLDADKQEAATQQLLAKIRAGLVAGEVPADAVDRAMAKWSLLDKVMHGMRFSPVGDVMDEIEQEALHSDVAVRNLLASILRAVEWAMVTCPSNRTLKSADFLAAWECCLKFDQQRTTASTRKP